MKKLIIQLNIIGIFFITYSLSNTTNKFLITTLTSQNRVLMKVKLHEETLGNSNQIKTETIFLAEGEQIIIIFGPASRANQYQIPVIFSIFFYCS